MILSDWQNADQNENAPTSDAMLLRAVQRACAKERENSKGDQVKIASVIHRVVQQSVSKVVLLPWLSVTPGLQPPYPLLFLFF